MNKPSDYLLELACPLELWNETEKQAKRSDHKRHRTGCVIYNPRDKTLLAKGCAHTHNGGLKIRSIHAEMDALTKAYKFKIHNYHGLIVTLTRSGNFATISKPCRDCALNLVRYGISKVSFAEKSNDNSWVVVTTDPSSIVGKPTRYRP